MTGGYCGLVMLAGTSGDAYQFSLHDAKGRFMAAFFITCQTLTGAAWDMARHRVPHNADLHCLMQTVAPP